MAEYENSNREIGWDDEISNAASSYILLEEGDYNFTVTHFERGRFAGKQGGKIPPCNKATLTLTVQTPRGEASAKYDLILWGTLQWKLAEFFRAIGQISGGEETFRPRWNEVIGSKGRARFKPRTYIGRDGQERETNDVDKFYDYDPAFFTAANTAPAGGWTPGAF